MQSFFLRTTEILIRLRMCGLIGVFVAHTSDGPFSHVSAQILILWAGRLSLQCFAYDKQRHNDVISTFCVYWVSACFPLYVAGSYILYMLFRCQHRNHTVDEQHVVVPVDVAVGNDHEYHQLQRPSRLSGRRACGGKQPGKQYHRPQLGHPESAARGRSNHVNTVHAHATHT